MGILGGFRELFVGAIHFVAGGIRDVITETLDIITEVVITVASDIRETFLFEGAKKRRLSVEDKEYVRQELRKQWLELAPGEKEIAGVEYEGEVYFDTPK